MGCNALFLTANNGMPIFALFQVVACMLKGVCAVRLLGRIFSLNELNFFFHSIRVGFPFSVK